MRNPAQSILKLPLSQTLGETVRELIDTGVSKFPHLKNTAEDIINGREEVRPLDPDAMAKLDNAMMVLFQPEGLPPKTVEAHTPIKAAILQGWAEHTEDPDAETLAKWLQQGAPLGFDEPIERTGVFPTCADVPIHRAEEMELLKDVDSWQNWPSATEEAEDLQKLIREAQLKGFCRVLEDNDENRRLLEGPQVLNKLGVVVKFQGPDNTKKSRIIWDMRESGVNQRCDPSERILLPRLMDAVHDALDLMRAGKTPILAAVDIADAFHNVPAGRDKKYTMALTEMENGKRHFVLYDVLVFGSRSSPTIWGRFAAFLGRAISAVVPEARTQVYVDDPLLTLPNEAKESIDILTRILIFTNLLGYPLKLSKASAGQTVKWIGASIHIDNVREKVEVTIPEDKVIKLLSECKTMLKSPVVGLKALRSLAGSLSFVAGLVPVMRPFLSPLWAAMSKDATYCWKVGAYQANCCQPELGGRVAGKRTGTLKRTFDPNLEDTGWEVITDACPWGIGGVLYHNKVAKRWFASHLPSELLNKFKASVGDPSFNTLWEAVALLVALRLWLPSTDRRLSTRIKSDNVGALRTLLKLTSPSQAMGVVARESGFGRGSRQLPDHGTGACAWSHERGRRCTESYVVTRTTSVSSPNRRRM